MKKDNNNNNPDRKSGSKPFDKFSTTVTKISGSSYAFIVAMLLIVMWACSGPVFYFSDAWQLVVNTGTSIITFLMVFIIQQSQNKDTMALQLKLKKFYCDLGELAEKDNNLFVSHSVEEAKEINREEHEKLRNSRQSLKK